MGMVPDRLTKLLLAAIALGLWANVASTWLEPTTVNAQGSVTEEFISNEVRGIANDVHKIEDGTCSNNRICPGIFGGR